jgi:hypothetical protein
MNVTARCRPLATPFRLEWGLAQLPLLPLRDPWARTAGRQSRPKAVESRSSLRLAWQNCRCRRCCAATPRALVVRPGRTYLPYTCGHATSCAQTSRAPSRRRRRHARLLPESRCDGGGGGLEGAASQGGVRCTYLRPTGAGGQGDGYAGYARPACSGGPRPRWRRNARCLADEIIARLHRDLALPSVAVTSGSPRWSSPSFVEALAPWPVKFSLRASLLSSLEARARLPLPLKHPPQRPLTARGASSRASP